MLDGDPVHILIHGLGGAKHLFADAFPEARARGIGLVAIDLPGFGESAPLPDDESYSSVGHAGAVRDVLCALGVGEYYLAVHSMSGALLPTLLSAGDGAIKGIALLEANLTEEDAKWSGEIAALDEAGFERYWNQLLKHAPRILGFQLHGSAPAERVSDWSRCFTSMDRRAFRETARSVFHTTCSDAIVTALKTYGGIKLYVRGAQSKTPQNPKILREIKTEYMEIPEAGHYLFLDNPAAFYPRLFDRMGRD